MSFLAAYAARLRAHRLCLRLMNPVRTSSAFEITTKTPYYSLTPSPLWLTCSTTTAAVQETTLVSPAEIEESSPVIADSAATLSVERIDDCVPRTLSSRKWNYWSRRTGLVAIKLGMTQLWSKEGFPIAVTVLQMLDNQVVMVRTKDRDGYFAVQIGAIDNHKLKNVPHHMQGQFKKAGVPPKRKLAEFRVTQDGLLPPGTNLYASHFYPGQYVDVCSKSIGKGFQGVMKRHGMKGQPASHGVTKTHRKMGATGGGQDPGRIWPGKKMPGRMGGKRVTTQNLKVYRVNNRFNVIYVHGPVPGHKNTYVRVSDAKRRHHKTPPPFPTFIPNPENPLAEEVYSDDIHLPHEGTIEFTDKRKVKQKQKR